MATGGNRSRGLVPSSNRPRLSVRAVYEDIKPPMESKEDADAHTVYIQLPGFLKEQIRIVAESSRGLLRVRGERPVSGNTWNRFQEEVMVPINCDITETRAKFEGGVLRITMPKRITSIASQSSSPAGLSDEATTPARSPPPNPAPLRPVAPPPSQLPPLPRPIPPSKTPAAESRPATALRPPAEFARQEDLPPQRTSAAVPRPEALPQPWMHAAAPRPEALPQPRLNPSIQPKPRDEAKLKPIPDASRFTPSINPNPKPLEDEKSRFEAFQPTAAKFSPPGLLQALPQPDPAPMKDPIASERRRMVESKIPAPMKDPIAEERRRTESEIPAPLTTTDSTEKVPKRYESLTEDEKRMIGMRGVSLRGLAEDRKLLVNMGAAVMVLVTFGAWISYSFGSSANHTN